jgi:chromosome segregation ATPase
MVTNDEMSDELSGKQLIRFDQPHKSAAANELVVPQPELLPVAVELHADAAEQMQVQASQLARHLQERRREVDHREAHLNARIAQLENDLRVSRLWLRERSEDFERREAELSQQLSEQDSQIRSLSASESALDEDRIQKELLLQEREAAVRLREEQIVDARGRLEAEAESLILLREELQSKDQNAQAIVQAVQAREAAVREIEEGLEKRQRALDAQEKSLDEQWGQLQTEREQWQQRVAETQDQLRHDRQAIQQQRRQSDEQRAQQHKTWVSRQERIDQQQVVLQRIRDDILRLHREALEMRLIAEQLWSQMTGRMAPAELTEGLSRLRTQLADEFRLAHQALATQRSELETLVAKLDDKRRALAAQRDELMGWLSRRQSELAEQSSDLAAREQQVLDEKQNLAAIEHRWQHERRDLHRQIRKLTLQIRPRELAAA